MPASVTGSEDGEVNSMCGRAFKPGKTKGVQNDSFIVDIDELQNHGEIY
jgi:hypothetical protein